MGAFVWQRQASAKKSLPLLMDHLLDHAEFLPDHFPYSLRKNRVSLIILKKFFLLLLVHNVFLERKMAPFSTGIVLQLKQGRGMFLIEQFIPEET